MNKTSHVPNAFSIMLAGSSGKAHRSNHLCRGQHPAASPGWALDEAGRESFCLAAAAQSDFYRGARGAVEKGKGSHHLWPLHWLMEEPLTSITSLLNRHSKAWQLTKTLAAGVPEVVSIQAELSNPARKLRAQWYSSAFWNINKMLVICGWMETFSLQSFTLGK